jgi:hypothetical protein
MTDLKPLTDKEIKKIIRETTDKYINNIRVIEYRPEIRDLLVVKAIEKAHGIL